MAADCKSAAPCELRRFESSPVHQFFRLDFVAEQVEVAGITSKTKLWVAFGLYVALAALAWTTLSEPRFRYATVAILAFFAVRTWTWKKRQDREESD